MVGGGERENRTSNHCIGCIDVYSGLSMGDFNAPPPAKQGSSTSSAFSTGDALGDLWSSVKTETAKKGK